MPLLFYKLIVVLVVDLYVFFDIPGLSRTTLAAPIGGRGGIATPVPFDYEFVLKSTFLGFSPFTLFTSRFTFPGAAGV